jgi:CRISPR/Cas system CSM-associated protein Csm2 small subunit
MTHRRTLLLTLLTGLIQAGPGVCEQAKEPTLAQLNLETTALYSIYLFKLTPAQQDKLRQLAKETAAKERPREAKADEEVVNKLREFRGALADAEDDDRIDQLADEWFELLDAQMPSLDDDVEVTEAARRRASELLRSLTPGQYANYVGQIADDVFDPGERLVEYLDKVRELKRDGWKQKRDEWADEVARPAAGLDEDKYDRLYDQVTAFLIKARSLSEKDFNKQRPELEKEARKLLNVAPEIVVRHNVEHALAELLSNPRLVAALQLRAKANH